jgi:hypothetical protein
VQTYSVADASRSVENYYGVYHKYPEGLDTLLQEASTGTLYAKLHPNLAAMLTTFERLVRERPAGAANVVLSCCCDEESTMRGIQALVAGRTPAPPAVGAAAPGSTAPRRVTRNRQGWLFPADGAQRAASSSAVRASSPISCARSKPRGLHRSASSG